MKKIFISSLIFILTIINFNANATDVVERMQREHCERNKKSISGEKFSKFKLSDKKEILNYMIFMYALQKEVNKEGLTPEISNKLKAYKDSIKDKTSVEARTFMLSLLCFLSADEKLQYYKQMAELIFSKIKSELDAKELIDYTTQIMFL